MNLKAFFYLIFSGLSRLYPKEFQEKYSEEMKSVFLDILEDSGASGNWHAIQCLLREFVYLPVCLLREYSSVNGGELMKSTRQVISASLFGFISLHFLLGIQSGTVLVFYNNSPAQPMEIMILQLIIGGILFGILIGGSISYVLSIKNKTAMMAICGLAYLAPRVLLNPEVLGFPNPWIDKGWGQLLLYTASPIYGFCFGMLVGLLWKGWKTGIVIGLASSLIFTIGFWSNRAAMSFVYNQGMDRIVDTKILSVNLWIFIYWVANNLLYGVIIGILWGILLDRLPRMRSIGWSTSD